MAKRLRKFGFFVIVAGFKSCDTCVTTFRNKEISGQPAIARFHRIGGFAPKNHRGRAGFA